MLNPLEARNGLKQLEQEQKDALAEIKQLLHSGENNQDRLFTLRGIVLSNRFKRGGLRERNKALRNSSKSEASRIRSVNW